MLDIFTLRRSSTGAVDSVNKRFHVVRRGELGNAVAQVENVPRAAPVGTEISDDFGCCALNGGHVREQDRRVQIALQRHTLAHAAFGLGNGNGPVQTERIGPLLDGSIKLVEGRGYEPDGRTTFNAFAVISWDAESKSYRIRSHAQGRYGDFAIRPTDDGYVWEIPMGPAMMRYTATIRDGVLKEVGDRLAPGREPLRVFEMVLNRVGDSPWPAAGAVPVK